MLKSNREKTVLYLSLGLILLVYIMGLLIDVTRDGAKYAYIAKEMLQTGNWIDLRIQGEAYEQKPHLTFWLSAVSFLIFGISNFSFKLPILIYSLAGFYATYRLGRAMYSKEIGKTAGLMMLFSAIMLLYNMDIHTDILLFSNVAFSLWFLYEYLTKNRLKYALAAGVAMGLAMLTKGPFGLVVPFFAVAGYIVSTKQFKQLLNPVWILVVAIAFAVTIPSFINLYHHWGWEGIKFFIWENNMGRVTGKYLGNTPDPTFYIHNLLYLFLPWTVTLFSGAWLSFNKLFKKKQTPADQFLFWAFWIVFITLSASKSKLPNYIMSLMPFAAVLSAETWHTYFNKMTLKGFTKRLVVSQQISIVALWILPIVAVTLIMPKLNVLYYIVPAILLVIAIIYMKPMEQGKRLFWHSALALTLLGGISNISIAPALFGQQAQPQAATLLNQQAKAGEIIYHFNTRVAVSKQHKGYDPLNNKRPMPVERHASLNYELMFYCNHEIIDITSFEELEALKNQHGIWIFTDEEGAEILKTWEGFDETFSFEHLDMRRAGKYLNPKKRASALRQNYLFHAFMFPIDCENRLQSSKNSFELNPHNVN